MKTKKYRISTIEDLKCFLKEFFTERNRKVKIILFGSRARNTHMEHSDVDIAIISDKNLENDIIELKNIIELSNLPQKVDIINFNKADKKLQEEILKEGITWIDLTKQ